MIRRIKEKLGLTPRLHPDPSDRERKEILGHVMKYIKYLEIPGDYFEFGVFEGDNLCRAAYYAGSADLKDIQFHAFDSFLGLPEFTEKDKGFNPFKPNEYKASRQVFESNLRNNRFEMQRLTTHEGWYDEVLPKLLADGFNTKVSIAWIDCDLYSSTLSALDFLTDLLVDGAIVLFDDWYCFKGYENIGEQGAFEAWLEKNKDISAVPYRGFGWHGRSFIIQRRGSHQP